MLASRNVRTQTALSKRSGVTQSTIGRILRGEVNPQSENLERLAMAFGMSHSTLAKFAEGNGSVEDFHQGPTPQRVPLIALGQAAGDRSDSLTWLECPKKRHGLRTFASKVSGESMEPEYKDGDVIYVDPDAAASHGKDVIAHLINRNAIAFKRLVVESDRLYLKPLNPNWPDKFISITTDDRIIGVVVGKYTDI
jgi:SOS-response transcriptional repressor LexA